MNKFELVLWTDEMVYARSAVRAQFDHYCAQWRKTFIEDGRTIASVYIPAINALRSTMREMDRAMPPR